MAFRAGFRLLALPIPDDIVMIHDAWIALMISAVARVAFIDEPLMLYRQHAAQQVGARSKPVPAASVLAALRRVTSYADTLTLVERVRERLRLKGAGDTTPALEELDAIDTHLRARAQLPAGRLARG
jgi:hypothetical protein